IPTHLQGQAALVLNSQKGQFFTIPYESADKNQREETYQLAMTDDGILEGTFGLKLMGERAQVAFGPDVKLAEDPVSAQKILTQKIDNFFSWRKAQWSERDVSIGLIKISGDIKQK